MNALKTLVAATLISTTLLLGSATAKESPAPIFPKKAKITLDLKNADVTSALELMAKKGGLSLAIDGELYDKITVQLENLPVDEAFRIICKTKNLTFEKIGPAIIVQKGA